jgi:hypothetical protein
MQLTPKLNVMEVFMFYSTHTVLVCCLTALIYIIAPQKDQHDRFDDWEE